MITYALKRRFRSSRACARRGRDRSRTPRASSSPGRAGTASLENGSESCRIHITDVCSPYSVFMVYVCLFVCLSDQPRYKSLHIKAGQQLTVCVCLQQFIYNVFMCSSHYTLNQTAVCVYLEQFIQCVQFPYSVCGAQRSMAKHKMDTIRKLLLST